MEKSYGWSFFNIREDFERMNVPPESWTMTTLNKDYDVSEQQFKWGICKLLQQRINPKLTNFIIIL